MHTPVPPELVRAALERIPANLTRDDWARVAMATKSEFLDKGVQPYGVRFAGARWLLVPVRDGAGKLWNLKRIAPEKPTDGGTDKLFLRNGRKSGLWHLIGNVGDDQAGPTVLLVCEGYATGASVHAATGHPVAVAFDAGNMAHVAKALRQLHPAPLIVVAGDDDVQTFARTGTNPGMGRSAQVVEAQLRAPLTA